MQARSQAKRVCSRRVLQQKAAQSVHDLHGDRSLKKKSSRRALTRTFCGLIGCFRVEPRDICLARASGCNSTICFRSALHCSFHEQKLQSPTFGVDDRVVVASEAFRNAFRKTFCERFRILFRAQSRNYHFYVCCQDLLPKNCHLCPQKHSSSGRTANILLDCWGRTSVGLPGFWGKTGSCNAAVGTSSGEVRTDTYRLWSPDERQSGHSL